MSIRTFCTCAVATAFAAVFLVSRAHAQLPAFPGADGAAQFVSGGRGGIVYHVTKLDPWNPLDGGDPKVVSTNYGTFWYGLRDANFPSGVPRTIVFDVGGVIHMGRADTTNWTSGGNAWNASSRTGNGCYNLTIAGQTAPGPVIFMGGTLKFSGSNQVVRNVTVAAGYGMQNFWEPDDTNPPSPGTLPLSYTMDAFEVDAQNIMLDHVDALYGSDEGISCNEEAESFTAQYCNSALAQNYNSHSYGHLLQPDTDHKLSYIHNLDAHIRGRLPRVGSEFGIGALNDFRNNVTYNWMGDAGYAGDSQYSYNNFINNFYLSGNGGDSDWDSTSGGGTGIFNGASAAYTAVYPSGNLKDTNKDGDPNDTSSADGNYANSAIQPSAYDIDIGVTLSAKDSFTNVLRYAGSRWWERDYNFTLGNTNAIDTINERIVHDVIAGTGRIQAWADDPYNVSGTYTADPANEGVEWRALWALRPTNGVAPFNRPANWDTDGDGMADYWEIEHALDPGVTNNNADFDNDGYTDLEEYLNDIAAWPAPGNIIFTGATNNRYALIHNWQVKGVTVNITNMGAVTTWSKWQPSRFDTAIISNSTVVVDSVGQHAGTLRLAPGAGNNATLNITNGWLIVSNTLEIGSAGTATVNLSGGLLRAGTLTNGASGAFNFTGGALIANAVGFNLTNQGGVLLPGGSGVAGQTHVTGSLTLQAGSSLAMDLGGTNAGGFDQIVVDGSLTLGGTVNVSNLAGFGAGTYTLLTYGGTLSGSLTLGSKPTGYGWALDTSVSGQVRLVVLARPPVFESVQAIGSDLVMSGSGPTNEMYYLLSSTNLTVPMSQWTAITTNTFDSSGQFWFTNAMDSSRTQTFYRLRVP